MTNDVFMMTNDEVIGVLLKHSLRSFPHEIPRQEALSTGMSRSAASERNFGILRRVSVGSVVRRFL